MIKDLLILNHMAKTKFYMLNSLFFLLFFNVKKTNAQDSTISGKAVNAKYGAVIMTSNDHVYYINKLESWNPGILEKRIKVVGKIVTKKLKKTDKAKGGITSPSIKIIKHPKIEVLSDS
jgi:hypothetical protein